MKYQSQIQIPVYNLMELGLVPYMHDDIFQGNECNCKAKRYSRTCCGFFERHLQICALE